MLFSQLNNDVILEIFLQFVTIDWDGPFTLMLVCSKWSNLVLSQPRVWTWIMVDETQAEWRERMEVGAHLSKNLPLQIVLRLPFETQVSLSHITRRCTSLFVDSKYLEDQYVELNYPEDPPFKHLRSWEKTITSYEQFPSDSAELKQSNDSISNFLKGGRNDGLQIRSEDQEYTSFAYSAWHVYERLNQRASLQEVVTSGEPLIITALVFKHGGSAPLPRVQVLVTDLWGVLPLLSNLCYLELADSYIRVPRNTILAPIELRSLQTLKIDSPMKGSVFLSLEDDKWLGLLSLLEVITAPNLEDLSLHSPLHRIIATMIKGHGRFPLLRLNISISVFDETLDQDLLDGHSVWYGLRRCTVHIPEQSKARRHHDFEVVGALRLLFNLIPIDCPVQLHGNSILDPILQSDLLMDVELYIVTPPGDSGGVRTTLNNPRKIRSLSLTGWSIDGGEISLPWISSIEELWVGLGSTCRYPHGGPLPMKVLNCAPHTLLQPESDHLPGGMWPGRFSNLRDLECDCMLAIWMIESNETPHLRSLTLSTYPPSVSRALEVVARASDRLLSLETLGIRGIPEWENLLFFVANFNRSRGRGISAMKLDGLPHPAILHHFGRAFRGEADEPQSLRVLFLHYWSQMHRRYPRGCGSCAWFGWSCYGRDLCGRWRSVDMVTITADMPLTKYPGDWGPDGQGWEDDLSSEGESLTGVEYEGSGDTSEDYEGSGDTSEVSAGIM